LLAAVLTMRLSTPFAIVLAVTVIGGCAAGHRHAASSRPGVCSPRSAVGPQHVTVAGTGLLVNGCPFFVKGGGVSQIEMIPELKARGANALRTWSDLRGRETLDAAQASGLMVAMGIWLPRELDKFNFSSRVARDHWKQSVLATVNRMKDHPALLAWDIGNELNLKYTDDRVWDFVNDLAEAIHEVDHDHPVMTVVTAFGDVPGGPAWASTGMMRALVKRAPELDLLGVNEYADLDTLPARLQAAGWNKPYLITEWGQRGWWEHKNFLAGTMPESSSGDRADKTLVMHEQLKKDPRCAGGFVFFWGRTYSATHTWFSLFLDPQHRLEPVDALEKSWTGRWPEHRAPHVTGLSFDGSPVPNALVFSAPGEHRVSVAVTTPGSRALKYRWELFQQLSPDPDGPNEHRLPLLARWSSEGPETEFLPPKRDGAYRLFSYVDDEWGGVGTANAAFRVTGFAGVGDLEAQGPYHLGAMYEGPIRRGATLTGATAYLADWDETGLFITTMLDTREGVEAHELVPIGTPKWLGGGLRYLSNGTKQTIDVSRFKTLHVSLKSKASTAATLKMEMAFIAQKETWATKTRQITAANYGFRGDNQWHDLAIPIRDFGPMDATRVHCPLSFGMKMGGIETSLKVDNVYLSED
jgi:hypothetical protein